MQPALKKAVVFYCWELKLTLLVKRKSAKFFLGKLKAKLRIGQKYQASKLIGSQLASFHALKLF